MSIEQGGITDEYVYGSSSVEELAAGMEEAVILGDFSTMDGIIAEVTRRKEEAEQAGAELTAAFWHNAGERMKRARAEVQQIARKD